MGGGGGVISLLIFLYESTLFSFALQTTLRAFRLHISKLSRLFIFAIINLIMRKSTSRSPVSNKRKNYNYCFQRNKYDYNVSILLLKCYLILYIARGGLQHLTKKKFRNFLRVPHLFRRHVFKVSLCNAETL